MDILGINCVYHESSACILRDGTVIAAAEEERFNRIKHGKQARADNPDELPLAAIGFCLRAADIEPGDVAHIAVAADPELNATVVREGRPSSWLRPEDQALFVKTLPTIPAKVEGLGFTGAFHWIPHHTAHAASAYFASPHDEAAILVVDALGDDAYSGQFYHGRDNRLTCLQSVPYPGSLGYLWELISVFLGFGVYDAAKVMGLAGYGDPARYAAAMRRIVWPSPDGAFDMAHDLLRFSEIQYYPPDAYCEGLREVFGLERRSADEPLRGEHHDVAAALQATTNTVVAHMTRHLHEMTGSVNLCLAGGVALNCVTNEHVFAEGPYEQLYVQPAANDAGLALGAAMQVWNDVLAQPRGEPMRHAYWGPSYSADEIEAALQQHDAPYERVEDIEDVIAELLSQERVVAYFHGAMEVGPRTLGNRSILADPRREEMRDILNHKVKHREYFRPLAPSVLAEEADAWFHLSRPTPARELMLMADRVREERRGSIAAVVHVDGTARVQLVRQEINPRFHRLIAAFAERTGVPMLLNTSFNDQEPIICSPSDALSTFARTQIDFLAIGPFLVHKVAP